MIVGIGNSRGSQWLVELHDKQGCSICKNTTKSAGKTLAPQSFSSSPLGDSEYILDRALFVQDKNSDGTAPVFN